MALLNYPHKKKHRERELRARLQKRVFREPREHAPRDYRAVPRLCAMPAAATVKHPGCHGALDPVVYGSHGHTTWLLTLTPPNLEREK
jgi:hypothetical protein